MKCEKHGVEMVFKGSMSRGSMVCEICSAPPPTIDLSEQAATRQCGPNDPPNWGVSAGDYDLSLED